MSHTDKHRTYANTYARRHVVAAFCALEWSRLYRRAGAAVYLRLIRAVTSGACQPVGPACLAEEEENQSA